MSTTVKIEGLVRLVPYGTIPIGECYTRGKDGPLIMKTDGAMDVIMRCGQMTSPPYSEKVYPLDTVIDAKWGVPS